MVFRAEGQFDRVAADGCGDGASDGWASDTALAIVSGEDRQECLFHLSSVVDPPPYRLFFIKCSF